MLIIIYIRNDFLYGLRFMRVMFRREMEGETRNLCGRMLDIVGMVEDEVGDVEGGLLLWKMLLEVI